MSSFNPGFTGETHTEDDPYLRLANGIIIQAVKDYRRDAKKLKKVLSRKPMCRADAEKQSLKAEELRANMASVKRFFYSSWFEALTAVDGPKLFAMLEKEVGVS